MYDIFHTGYEKNATHGFSSYTDFQAVREQIKLTSLPGPFTDDLELFTSTRKGFVAQLATSHRSALYCGVKYKTILVERGVVECRPKDASNTGAFVTDCTLGSPAAALCIRSIASLPTHRAHKHDVQQLKCFP